MTFLPEILLFILMMGIMIAGSIWKKLPMSLVLIIAAVAGALCAGLGLPMRAMIEGTQQFFQLSELSLYDNEIADADELKMAEVTISGRGVFRVAIVKGKGSGMLTLYLQPRRG